MTNVALKTKTLNGVNLLALHDTIKAIRTQPSLGASKFRIRNQWQGRALNRTTVGDFFVAGQERQHKKKFVYDNDEADILLGEDNGANPVEYLLHALAGCVTTTTVYHAAARGIQIHKLETEIEGDIDLQGLLQTNPEVPAGFQNIRVRMTIESDAQAEKLEELKKLYLLSPVFGTLTHPANIEVQMAASFQEKK